VGDIVSRDTSAPFIEARKALQDTTASAGIGHPAGRTGGTQRLQDLTSNPLFRILPLTDEVALDAASLGVLRDPADRAIAAAARVHRLRLLTPDRRIIESKLVPAVE
jgi:predicted nucleic acid-binding protein